MVVIFRRRVPSKCGGADQRLPRWSPALLSCWSMAPLLRPSCRQRLPLQLLQHHPFAGPPPVEDRPGHRRLPAGECRAGAIGCAFAAPAALGAAGREPAQGGGLISPTSSSSSWSGASISRSSCGRGGVRMMIGSDRRSARWSRQLPRRWPDHGVVGRKGMGAGRHELIPGSKRCRRPLRRNLMSINQVSAPHPTPGNFAG